MVVETLSSGPIGFVKPLVRPEFYLVKSAGPAALACFFRAYETAQDAETRRSLAVSLKMSFGMLIGDVWAQEDEDDLAVAKIKVWFESHVSKLRRVEVYAPVGSRQRFFDQGMKDQEKLVGLFFVAP